MSTRVVKEERASRAQDRLQVLQARSHRQRWRLIWLLVGPGILVMLGENDAPSMLSYSATGAQFGIGFFLPFVLLTFAMAFVAQEITVRLGAVSKTGHADLIYRRFGRFWGNFAMSDLLFTNLLTLVTEFVGIVAGAGFFGIPKSIAVLGGVGMVSLALVAGRYWVWERVTLILALTNLVFVPVAILSHPLWGQVTSSFLTWHPFPVQGFGSHTLVILLADIGATITPWMLFFQQGAVSDKGLTLKDVAHGRLDTAIGAVLATMGAAACIVATSALFTHHMNASQFNAAEFAQALTPYVGHLGSALFAFGILEAGLVAATTISTSSAYAFGEVTRRAHSLNAPAKKAPSFYLVLILVAASAGAVVLLPGFPLEAVVIMVNVIAVLTMPPAIGFLLILANDGEVMGRLRSGRWLNTLGISVGMFVSLAGIIYALTVIIPGFHL